MKSMRENIGARLRRDRRAARLRLQDVADQLGRSKQAVAAWETGRSDLTAVQLAHLAQLYGVSADRILFDMPSGLAKMGGALALVFGRAPAPDLVRPG